MGLGRNSSGWGRGGMPQADVGISGLNSQGPSAICFDSFRSRLRKRAGSWLQPRCRKDTLARFLLLASASVDRRTSTSSNAFAISMAVGIMKPGNGHFRWAKHQNWHKLWREEVNSPCPVASKPRKTRRNCRLTNRHWAPLFSGPRTAHELTCRGFSRGFGNGRFCGPLGR